MPRIHLVLASFQQNPRFARILLCLLIGLSLVFSWQISSAAPPKATYTTAKDIAYLATTDDYQRQQCQLDLYLPQNRPGFATVIWFHGGGLSAGRREFPDLRNQETALVSVGYRLSPKASPDEILQDAAAATAWVLQHIAEYGGDPNKVFIAGHSAGGYLATMVGMDARWLKPHGVSHQQLAGIISVSGQVSTHFLVKKQRGDTGPELRLIVDEYAPLYHAAKDLPPICLILGDRKIEYRNRVEENQLFATSLRNLGHSQVEFYEMAGLDHSSVQRGAWLLMPSFIKRTLAQPRPAKP